MHTSYIRSTNSLKLFQIGFYNENNEKIIKIGSETAEIQVFHKKIAVKSAQKQRFWVDFAVIFSEKSVSQLFLDRF